MNNEQKAPFLVIVCSEMHSKAVLFLENYLKKFGLSSDKIFHRFKENDLSFSAKKFSNDLLNIVKNYKVFTLYLVTNKRIQFKYEREILENNSETIMTASAFVESEWAIEKFNSNLNFEFTPGSFFDFEKSLNLFNEFLCKSFEIEAPTSETMQEISSELFELLSSI